jgi:WS/DGAT/MGAT family acyltransferase
MSIRGQTSRPLSALDGSFLRLESPHAHMHVGWSAVLGVPDGGNRLTLRALRQRVAKRLDEVGWCRWRLQSAPLGLSEPTWVDDGDFDLAAHVLALGEPDEAVSYERFGALRDTLLSAPLDRSRALWQIFLVPRLEDGRVGMIGKVHHALVDGIAALQIVGLIVDESPDAATKPSTAYRAGEQGLAGWALDRLTRTARDGLGALRATAGAGIHPRASIRGAARDAQRLLRVAREDFLPSAPDSVLNVSIGARRTLVGYHASRADLRAARARGGTLNDIGLAMVAGALRTLAMRRGDPARAPLKAMVPVSMRRSDQLGPGNRISMVSIQLPVHLASPVARLEWVREQTQSLKASGRAEGTQTVYAAGGLLPAPLRSPLVKAMASPRVFNLTVSQSPGPRGPVHVLGCEVQEVYSVVPIAEGHALAIGMVRYRHDLFVGCYADPDALPDVRELPALLEAELRALGHASPPRGAPDGHVVGSNARGPAPPAPVH